MILTEDQPVSVINKESNTHFRYWKLSSFGFGIIIGSGMQSLGFGHSLLENKPGVWIVKPKWGYDQNLSTHQKLLFKSVEIFLTVEINIFVF